MYKRGPHSRPRPGGSIKVGTPAPNRKKSICIYYWDQTIKVRFKQNSKPNIFLGKLFGGGN